MSKIKICSYVILGYMVFISHVVYFLLKIMREVLESLKYKSEVFKIAGFALTSPVGGVILNPKLYFELDRTFYIFYLCICLFLGLMGLILIVYGYNLLMGEDKK